MEELRSTEVLDKEIRADSRKKAERIIQGANDEAQKMLSDLDARIDKSRAELNEALSSRISVFKKNLDSSLPLEKQRYCVKFIHESIIKKMNEWFDRIKKDGRLKIIKSMVKDSLAVIGSKEVTACAVGISESEASSLLKDVLKSQLVECKAALPGMQGEVLELFDFHEGVILKTTDGSVLCRLTLDEKVRSLLDEKKYELASSLFAGRLPE